MASVCASGAADAAAASGACAEPADAPAVNMTPTRTRPLALIATAYPVVGMWKPADTASRAGHRVVMALVRV